MLRMLRVSGLLRHNKYTLSRARLSSTSHLEVDSLEALTSQSADEYYAVKRKTETRDMTKRRLIWQSSKRGMVENELFLSRFAKDQLNQLTDAQISTFDTLLQQNDVTLNKWLTGRAPIPEEFQTDVMTMVITHINKEPIAKVR